MATSEGWKKCCYPLSHMYTWWIIDIHLEKVRFLNNINFTPGGLLVDTKRRHPVLKKRPLCVSNISNLDSNLEGLHSMVTLPCWDQSLKRTRQATGVMFDFDAASQARMISQHLQNINSCLMLVYCIVTYLRSNNNNNNNKQSTECCTWFNSSILFT